MKNIIKEFYDNLCKYKEKEFANFINNGSEEILTYDDICKFINYFNSNIGTSNYTKKIGILIENSTDFVKAFMMILFNGYIAVAIDPLINVDGLEKIIKENDLEYLLVNNKTDVKKIIDNNVKIINVAQITAQENGKVYEIESKLEDIIVISYTSGTSGKFSKGVILNNENVSFVSEEYNKIYSINDNSKIITVLPLWHNYAMFACLTNAMMGNAQIIIMEKWNLDEFLNINRKYKPDIFPGSPYMYIDIINADLDKIDISSLKICDSGGDSLPIECIKKFEEKTNAIITEGYGLTETVSLTHFNYSAKERKIGSLGKSVTNVKCKITDLNGNEIGRNKWGLLWIKGPMVFKGYVGNEKLTNDVLINGWFNTYDVVKVDDDGYYFIAGRLSDIKNYKENDITLRDIENTIYKFEGIKRAFIKKIYNAETGFSSYDIYAILKDGYNEYQIIDYVKTSLKSIVIDNIKIVDKLPTTGTGKIKRNKLS